MKLYTHGKAPNPKAPPEGEDAVLHARMNIGETELFCADIPGCQPMRSAYLTLIAGSNDKAERIYTSLSDHAEIFTPIAATFFAFRFISANVQYPRPNSLATPNRKPL